MSALSAHGDLRRHERNMSFVPEAAVESAATSPMESNFQYGGGVDRPFACLVPEQTVRSLTHRRDSRAIALRPIERESAPFDVAEEI